MTRKSIATSVVLLLAVVLWSCTDDQGPTQGEGQISGVVTDVSTGNALADVTIQAISLSRGNQNAVTDAGGNYSFIFELDSTLDVNVSLTKSGYRDTTISIVLQAGAVFPLSVQMTPRSVIVGGGGGGTGLAQTIAFLGSNPTEVSVYGVGGLETSILGFEVRDSLGLPIDAQHAVNLTFSSVSGPNGGEYISPPAVTTNSGGQAFTTFNSGIRSGVVQLVATAIVGSRTISSSPVRVIINAGFPDQAHFTVAATRFNFPALGIMGRRNPVSVLVGDVYSNPVVQNTAVYMRSSAGVIQASIFTNADGEGAVDLISGNPAPFGIYAAPGYGNGYHWAVARTIGQGGIPVQDSILLLWSGASQISNLSPGTFTIPNGGFQDFTFTVSDYLGHPLSAGTNIRVVATVPPPPNPNWPVNQVHLGFGVEGLVTLEDIIFPGPGATDFTFRLSDGSIQLDSVVTAVTLTVSVESGGQNGNAYTTINGTVE